MSTIKEHYNTRYRNITAAALPPEEHDTFAVRVQSALQNFPPPPARVLEYGCGRGGAVRRFCDAGYMVEAIDLSEEVIRLAQDYEPRASYTVIDSEQSLPFPDESFDACYSSEVIEHVFDIRCYLSEIHRVLKPGGVLVLTTPYHAVVKNILIALHGFERHYNPYHGHIRFFTRNSLTRCLADYGFAVQSFRGLGRCWPIYKTMSVAAKRV